ncbi:glycosyltransferase [Paenibacillus sp. sgz302251]|uniref:glycosyltransferase n=1 Tax=Paenibacillus sp. sgz302251 TaxID=3414493 RepID=UPI003C7CD657
MKKNLIFVIDSLDVAGAEKSLVTLLSMIDYSKFSVDLMLFGHGGELEEFVPKEVHVLPPLKYIKFSKLNIKEAIVYSLKKLDFNWLRSRAKYSISIRMKKYSDPQKARIFWQSVSQAIESNYKTYDIAISYAQGVPTFYVAEKVKAMKKIAWVNTSFRLENKDREFQKKFYDQYNQIVAVSDSSKEIFIETFPEYTDKMRVIYDINNSELILKMADIGESFDDQFDGIRILTIGRLNREKGYDMALAACRKLKDTGIKFKWYVLGKGPQKEEIEKFIKEYGLSDYFILLGVKSNPYPYIKHSDIYVQTSRYEGFGLAIAEARMLNVPVITTKFDAVFNQMIDGRNGLVVDMNGDAVYDGIMMMINNKSLRETIINYLRVEKKGNVEELDKFYQLIG